MKKASIVLAVSSLVVAASASADVTDFTQHLKRQGVNRYKLVRPSMNTYDHINITTGKIKGAIKFIMTPTATRAELSRRGEAHKKRRN